MAPKLDIFQRRYLLDFYCIIYEIKNNKIRQKLNINYDHLQMATEWKNPVVIWSTSLVEMV